MLIMPHGILTFLGRTYPLGRSSRSWSQTTGWGAGTRSSEEQRRSFRPELWDSDMLIQGLLTNKLLFFQPFHKINLAPLASARGFRALPRKRRLFLPNLSLEVMRRHEWEPPRPAKRTARPLPCTAPPKTRIQMKSFRRASTLQEQSNFVTSTSEMHGI